MKKAGLLFLVMVLLTASVLAGCGTDDGLTEITVSEVAHSVFYAPQYAAISLGFFEEEGLSVDLVNGQGADKVMTSVISGEVQIGLAGPEASIYVYNEGKEDYAQVFAQITNKDGAFLVGREPDENFTYDSLKGKTIIGGRKGGVPEMALEYAIKKHGVKLEEMNIDTSIQFANMGGAYAGGYGDYVTLYEPTASQMVAEGKGYILTSVGEDCGEMPFTAYFANKSYIEENPEIIQKFTNAIYKGQQWVQNATPEEIASVIVDFFPDTDEELLATVAQRYKEIDAWAQDPILEQASFELLQDVMQEAGELEQRVPYDSIIRTDFAQAAMK